MENKNENILLVDCSKLTQYIAPDLFFTNGRNPCPNTYKGTNIFFLGDSTTKILIDAGDQVLEYQKNLDLIIDNFNITISHVIITHFHHDHTQGLLYVLKRFPNIPIFKFKGDADIMKFDQETETKLGFEYLYIKDEEILKIDKYEFKILHLPGHSNDSIGIYDYHNKRLFIGDTVLGEGTGTYITDLKSYLNSLKRIKDLDIDCLLPAHGDIIFKKENTKKQIMDFFENRMKREKEILEKLKLKKILKFKDLFNEIYQNVPKNLHQTARNNLQAHINKLELEQVIISEVEGDDTILIMIGI